MPVSRFAHMILFRSTVFRSSGRDTTGHDHVTRLKAYRFHRRFRNKQDKRVRTRCAPGMRSIAKVRSRQSVIEELAVDGEAVTGGGAAVGRFPLVGEEMGADGVAMSQ